MPTELTPAPAKRAGRGREPALRAKPRGFRFTDTFMKKIIDNLDLFLNGRREVIQFEEASGLGVRVSQTGQISFIVQLKLKDGGRHRETLGSYGKLTVHSARAAAQALAGKIAMGVDLQQERAEAEAKVKAKASAEEAKKFTVGVLADQWRRRHLVKQRPSYAKRAHANVERTFKHLYAMPAIALTRADVRKAVDKALEPRKTKKVGPGSHFVGGPSAARNAAASLHAAYRWAFAEELIDQDPLSGLKLPALGPDRDRVLTIDEARRIYVAAGRFEYPARHFIRLLMLTACRRAEVAGLRWDEIVAEESGDQALELRPARTKNNRGHHIPLSREALAVIEDIKRRHRIVGCPYVLSSDGWRAFGNFERVKGWLDQALADDGGAILDWRWHDTRRTVVSTLARKPFRYNPVMLDLLLGHQPTTLTPVARIYAREQHIDDRREALEAWGKHLTQAPATVTALSKRKQR